jgi:hypothetical protein
MRYKRDKHMFVHLTQEHPKYCKIPYGQIVCDFNPHKKEQERVRIPVGGYRLDYSSKVATPTSDITTFKILINSNLSTEDTDMMMMKIKKYYLGTPFNRYEYICMPLKMHSS